MGCLVTECLTTLTRFEVVSRQKPFCSSWRGPTRELGRNHCRPIEQGLLWGAGIMTHHQHARVAWSTRNTALLSCEECKVIYQELLELVEISRQTKPKPDATPQQLAARFDQQDEDEDYRMRVRPRAVNAHTQIDRAPETDGPQCAPATPAGAESKGRRFWN